MLTRNQIISALKHLGQLGQAQGKTIELLVVGGVALMLGGYQARLSTHDVDVVILAPSPARWVRELASQVAEDQELNDDWMNDAAKGFLVGQSQPLILWKAPGIVVMSPPTEQLLAMKLSAWRDDQDINDAHYLLRRLVTESKGSTDSIWSRVEPHLLPGRELKARYAFLETYSNIFGGTDAYS
jgi:hypothetical protein